MRKIILVLFAVGLVSCSHAEKTSEVTQQQGQPQYIHDVRAVNPSVLHQNREEEERKYQLGRRMVQEQYEHDHRFFEGERKAQAAQKLAAEKLKKKKAKQLAQKHPMATPSAAPDAAQQK